MDVKVFPRSQAYRDHFDETFYLEQGVLTSAEIKLRGMGVIRDKDEIKAKTES